MPIRAPSKRATVAVVLVPSRVGSSSTSSPIRSCARWSAPATRVSRSWSGSAEGASSRRRSCWMAVLDATSPRAAPPTPSHTAISQGPTYPESWLSLRTRPTSEVAAYRRRRVAAGATGWSLIRLLPELQDRLADADLGPEGDRRGLGDAHGADERAVGGAEVLDEPLVAGGGDPRVPRRDVVVVEADRGVGAAADEHRRLGQLGAGADVRPGGDDHVGGRGAALLGRLGGLGCLAAGAAGAENVGADHRDRGQHEDPEDREVRDPDEEQRQLGHSASLDDADGHGR